MKARHGMICAFVLACSNSPSGTDVSAKSPTSENAPNGPSPSTASPKPPTTGEARVDDAIRDLHTLWVTSKDRVWPGLVIPNRVVILQGKEGPDYVWSPAAGVVRQAQTAEIDASWRVLPVNAIEFEGQRAILANLDAPTIKSALLRWSPAKRHEFLMRLFAHETFHFLTQAEWGLPSAVQIGIVYPGEAEPRLVRRMMFEELLLALNEPDASRTHLARAAHWHDAWKSKYSTYTETTDVTEGSATYIEVMSHALLNLTAVTDESAFLEQGIRVANIKDLPSPMSLFERIGYASPDREAYAIGAVSLLLLRIQDPSLAWTQRVQKGETPAGILLNQVAPSADAPEHLPASVQSEVTELVATRNEQIGSQLGQAIEDYDSTAFVHIVIPNTWTNEPFGRALPFQVTLKDHLDVSVVTIEPFGPFWKTAPAGDGTRSIAIQPKTPVFFSAPAAEILVRASVFDAHHVRGTLKGDVEVAIAHGITGTSRVDSRGVRWFDVTP